METLETKTEWKVINEGDFHSSYTILREKGYEVKENICRGLKLRIPLEYKWQWATLTREQANSWMAVIYNYEPSYFPADNEPRKSQ